MSRICFGSWLVAAVLLMPVQSEGRYSGGDGSPEYPYRIGTPNDLNDIGNHIEDFNKCFVMVNDINLADYTGESFNIIGKDFQSPFTGIFDGNGHSISNFCWSLEGSYGQYIGIFGVLDGGAYVENLHMENVDLNAQPSSDFVGAVVGFNYVGWIVNCSASGRILACGNSGGLVGYNERYVIGCRADVDVLGTSWCNGGLVGVNFVAAVVNCSSIGDVQGLRKIGGLVGATCAGRIEESYATGNVKATKRFAGGLVGWNDGEISFCYSTGTVEGSSYVGGLVGHHAGTDISNSYALGSARGNSKVGGLAGSIYATWVIDRCYATGPVDGNSYTGGLTGYHSKGIYTSCFWDNVVNPDANGIGNTTDSNVIGQTTTEMQTESTFTDAGWDFVTPIWKMCDEPNYPILWWQECPVAPLELGMRFTPPVLNPKSKAKWLKAHLVLPEGYVVEDVDTNTPCKVTEPFEPDIESKYMNVFMNDDGFVEIEAVFDRRAFCQAGISGGVVEVRVEGKFISGQGFFGTDTIRVIDNTFRDLGIMASYWLEGGCSQPDWCEGSDVNQDSVINLGDFALIDGCCIEVVAD